MDDKKAMAEGNTILRGVVGSTAHGISIKKYDDRDEMGVFIEPPSCVLGLQSLEHYTFRTQLEGVRSGPGDLDLVIYGLRKYCRLAVQGNPTVILLLHLPENAYTVMTPFGRELVGIRQSFVSRSSGRRNLGYLRNQRSKLNGERSPCVSRPELVAEYGYDTKFAGHAVRLGIQGVEYLTTGRLTLPMPEAQLIRDIRLGKYSKDDVLSMIDDAEARLIAAIEGCPLSPDCAAVERFLIGAYLSYWPTKPDSR